jgi:dTDP-N-acetylfucosamine:lipid II N-acetylfucosaminyltransferase
MILHLIEPNKFTTPLTNFLINDGRFKNHHFLSISSCGIEETCQKSSFRSPISRNIFYNIKKFLILAYKADKIILHGPVMIHFLFVFPFFFKKLLWSINGYELGIICNGKGLYPKMLKFVFKNVNGHLTHVKGDSDLANAVLKSKAKYLYSAMYLSNLVDTNYFYFEDISKKQKVNVLVGNSTDPTNNHIEIFNILEEQIEDIDKIYCPLSYGIFQDYKDSIIKEGTTRFGDKFIALTDFMTIEEYTEFLKTIDVAVFNHNRQQAMGVTISLLSLGKIVYVKEGTTSYKSLKERGFAIFENALIGKHGIKCNRSVAVNKELLERYYSKEQLLESYLKLT